MTSTKSKTVLVRMLLTRLTKLHILILEDQWYYKCSTAVQSRKPKKAVSLLTNGWFRQSWKRFNCPNITREHMRIFPTLLEGKNDWVIKQARKIQEITAREEVTEEILDEVWKLFEISSFLKE